MPSAIRTVIAAAALALAAAPTLEAQTAPTYNREVGAILHGKCAGCHRPNQIAPMSLMNYREARPWARAIKAKVVAREMPPWFADPKYGKFANDASLSAEEIATIAKWVDAGAPEGPGSAPTPPRFSDAGWSHPSGADPDYVIEFPIAWQIAPEGETPNFNLFTPMPFDDSRLVSATQVRPGNYAATHHITTGLVNMPPGMKLGTGPAWAGGPVVDYVPVPDPNADPAVLKSQAAAPARNGGEAEDDDVARARSSGFGPYIPGVSADVARPGQSREIRGDLFKYIVWNLHYQATGKPETARPSIGVWWAPRQQTTVVRSLGLREYTSEGKQLVAAPPVPRGVRTADSPQQVGQGLNPMLAPIPPNDANWTVTGIGAFQSDATIQSLFLHMHVRGKDVTYLLTYPDGRERTLLRIPNYKFDWQFEYQLAEPVKAPAGSTVKAIARYDNSPANELNPAPHKEVYWSEQSWDDMFLANVKYTLDDEVSAAGRTQGQP
jgi:mono/diheme cytochrome c family protein